MQQRSSVAGELGWLLYWVVAFVLLVYLFNIFIVPLHFNDKVADVLAGIFSGLIMIVTRAYVTKRRSAR